MLSVEVNGLLCLVLREVPVLEHTSDFALQFVLEFIALGEGEVGVGFGCTFANDRLAVLVDRGSRRVFGGRFIVSEKATPWRRARTRWRLRWWGRRSSRRS
jgi:hypothetical protein